jgi:nucleoside 2-deoxyribosyltransferase
MVFENAPEKCFITDMTTESITSDRDDIEYKVEFGGKVYKFDFYPNHINSEFVENNKYILKGLLLNNLLPFDRRPLKLNNEKLEKIINEAQIPRTPKDKLDNLILALFENQQYDGAIVDFKKSVDKHLMLCQLYFKNNDECGFYMNTLRDQGLITFIDTSTNSGFNAISIKLTFKGLEYIINLQENGENSKKCFIAMSFSESATEIRNTLKKAVAESGYEPILIDEIHYHSDITINDAIIRFIKESKFLIADFSEQKHGVYFEAGYALGLKRPVIYTCSKVDFDNTHFDTNHYPHIVYETMEELESKLKNKILAWIE